MGFYDPSRSPATLDAFGGIDIDVGGRTLTIQALTFGDAVRLIRLAQQMDAGVPRAGAMLAVEFPRMIGVEPELLDGNVGDVFMRVFDPEQWQLRAPVVPGDASEPQEPAAPPSLDDILCDYAVHYNGLPRERDPWPLVVALIARIPRQEARAALELLDGVTVGIAGALGSGAAQSYRDLMVSISGRKQPQKHRSMENTLATAGTTKEEC